MTDMTLWLLLFFFLTILLTGAPIGAALGLSSAIVIYATMNVPLIVVAQRMFTSVDSFSFMAVPFSVSSTLRTIMRGSFMTRLQAVSASVVQSARGPRGRRRSASRAVFFTETEICVLEKSVLG